MTMTENAGLRKPKDDKDTGSEEEECEDPENSDEDTDDVESRERGFIDVERMRDRRR